ncbi:MAG: hypothetical protein ACI9R3_001060 [Verrucomicrobiales bacterium]|jgi:hypothetical protein
MKPPTLLILALVWLGSIGGAYYIGSQNASSPAGATDSSSPTGTATLTRVSDLTPGRTGTPADNEAEPQGPVDVSALIRQAKIKLGAGGMMNFSSMIDIGSLLKSIPYEQIPDAIAKAEKIKNPQIKQMMVMMLMSRWAEKDGMAALKYAEKMEENSGGGMLGGAGAKMAVLQTWGQREPDAAWKWYLAQRDDKKGGSMLGSNAMALMGIFGGLVSKDPTTAFERLAEVEDTQARQMALGGMMQHITDPEVQHALGDYLSSLDESERNMATQGVMGQWAMLDPEGMMEFAKSRPDDERKSLVKQAGQTLLYTDPDRGVEMILENSDAKDLPDSYQLIAQSIATRDPEKAATWMSEQPQGPELDKARTSYANTVAQRDPESAMTWAKTITDENSRTSTVSSVYRQWHKKDAVAADASLPESGLSAESVEQLLKEIDSEN